MRLSDCFPGKHGAGAGIGSKEGLLPVNHEWTARRRKGAFRSVRSHTLQPMPMRVADAGSYLII